MVIDEQYKQTVGVLNPWHYGRAIDLGIERTKYIQTISNFVEERKEILFIVGSRRVGKTMLLFQYIFQLIKNGTDPKKILFLSLDNTNLQGLDLFTFLSQSDYDFIILDEVHFFPNWAQTLKSLYDIPNFNTKIICSGSSSKLIEDNKAFLTGRSTTMIVYPLSYVEFQHFNKSNHQLKDYLYYGGYPEYVLEKQPNYLNELIRDILEKDILKLYNVKNSQYLLDICQILAKQIGFKGSPNKISKVLGLDNKTVVNYIEYLREVKLIETVYQYSTSLNERLYSPKKYYFNDLGMRNSFSGFSDIGSLVENAVFIKLSELFGFENINYLTDTNSNEIDFVVKTTQKEVVLVESKYNNLKESILNSLSGIFLDDIHEKNIKKRIIITNNLSSIQTLKDIEIQLISLEDFLVNGLE